MARLLEKYKTEIVGKLEQELGRDNALSIPKLRKIVVSVGMGKAVQEGLSKAAETRRFTEAREHLATITGQLPAITKARKSVSNFKVRKGYDVGLKVTLRGKRMYEFLDRLVSLAIPRVRDFRGLNASSFDGHGNYGLGLSEYGVFPEINPDKVTYQQGMNITICASAGNDAEARQLLTHLGLPFRT